MGTYDAMTMMDAATGGSFDVESLRGPQMASTRKSIMEELLSGSIPKRSCGVNALRDALIDDLCIDTHGMTLRDINLAIADELRKVKKIGNFDISDMDEVVRFYF